MDTTILTLETRYLLTPFAELRMRHAASLEQLTQAIAEAGQLVPMLVTAGKEAGQWVLIDGYRRLEVLRRLDIEQVKAQLLPGDEKDAMLLHLAHGQARAWEAIEEAGLIRELHERCGLSLRHIAASIGRHVSWV
ncbi:MAG: ParB/RepB/Spo0J family partition protein [Magnetococcus sp. YQC-3]